MKLHQLVEKLLTKNQDLDIEAIVLGTDGQVIVMDVEKQAKPIAKLMKLFKGPES